MTTDVPSGLSSSSIDARPSALTRASIVLSVGSDVPERMSATVPRPRPAASANARIVLRPRRFISSRVRAATNDRASARAEFRTARDRATAASTTTTMVTTYNSVVQVSGIPRRMSHQTNIVSVEQVFVSKEEE